MQLNVNKPCSVYIKFTYTTPQRFALTNEYGKVYYFRILNGKYPRIKFNILHPGTYTGNVPFEVTKIGSVEYPETLPALPEPDRNRFKPFKIVDNFTLNGSPARIFTGEGIIERGRSFYDLPEPIRVFILLHEVGHFHYSKEEDADLFALVHYLKMGYNRSMAFYALSQVLKKSDRNLNRLRELLRNIQKTQLNEITK
jgi:hypothetical protein